MAPQLLMAFQKLNPNPTVAHGAFETFREQMATPPRAYHTALHAEAVLRQLYAWTDEQPSLPLVAAALYHDVIYDAARHDNELQSAVFAHDALTTLGVTTPDIVRTTNLILATRFHQPHLQDRDEVLMVDADLYILGTSAEDYAAYVAAIREEYAHVAEADWRVGRVAVMERFLQREHIYWGDWEGGEQRETAARANIAREVFSLAPAE